MADWLLQTRLAVDENDEPTKQACTNQEVAAKNKHNRTNVKHHQSMGSHSYISRLYTYVSAKNLVQYIFYLCVDTKANFSALLSQTKYRGRKTRNKMSMQ